MGICRLPAGPELDAQIRELFGFVKAKDKFSQNWKAAEFLLDSFTAGWITSRRSMRVEIVLDKTGRCWEDSCEEPGDWWHCTISCESDDDGEVTMHGSADSPALAVCRAFMHTRDEDE